MKSLKSLNYPSSIFPFFPRWLLLLIIIIITTTCVKQTPLFRLEFNREATWTGTKKIKPNFLSTPLIWWNALNEDRNLLLCAWVINFNGNNNSILSFSSARPNRLRNKIFFFFFSKFFFIFVTISCASTVSRNRVNSPKSRQRFGMPIWRKQPVSSQVRTNRIPNDLIYESTAFRINRLLLHQFRPVSFPFLFLAVNRTFD